MFRICKRSLPAFPRIVRLSCSLATGYSRIYLRVRSNKHPNEYLYIQYGTYYSSITFGKLYHSINKWEIFYFNLTPPCGCTEGREDFAAQRSGRSKNYSSCGQRVSHVRCLSMRGGGRSENDGLVAASNLTGDTAREVAARDNAPPAAQSAFETEGGDSVAAIPLGQSDPQSVQCGNEFLAGSFRRVAPPSPCGRLACPCGRGGAFDAERPPAGAAETSALPRVVTGVRWAESRRRARTRLPAIRARAFRHRSAPGGFDPRPCGRREGTGLPCRSVHMGLDVVTGFSGETTVVAVLLNRCR